MNMIKHVIVLCAVLLVCLGCICVVLYEPATLPSPTEPTVSTTAKPQVTVPLTLLGNGYAYSKLDQKQQQNYEAVVQALYQNRGADTYVNAQRGLEIPLPHMLRNEAEVEALFTAVYDDHPEFFYLSAQYGWVKRLTHYMSLNVFYLWDANERAQKAAELEAAVQALVSSAEGLDDVEAELLFHDAITARCEYNEAAANAYDPIAPSLSYLHAGTPYAALCSGDPICGGYSRAFQLLLSRVGIVSTPIDNDEHTWTMVWLENVAYHVDVTWDDPIGGIENHDYFNVTDAEIRATRDYPAQSRAVSAAQSTAHNYFVMNDWYFTDAFDDALYDVIRSQIESGRTVVELKFARDAFIDADSRLFDDEGYFEAVYALDSDALRDTWYGAVLYKENDKIGTIRICPENL